MIKKRGILQSILGNADTEGGDTGGEVGAALSSGIFVNEEQVSTSDHKFSPRVR